MRWWRLRRKQTTPPFELPRCPGGYSGCLRCRRSWRTARGHDTCYSTSERGRRGMFPLCESCWSDLRSPEARLPYYIGLRDIWIQQGASDVPDDATLMKALTVESLDPSHG